jgi:Lipocalin-like domain
MNRRSTLSLAASTVLGLALLPGAAVSQQKTLQEQLVGPWTLVSFETVDSNGAKVPSFEGTDLKGLLIFTSNGRFSLQAITLSPKLASNARLISTPQEDKAVAHGVISYFGTYSVDEASKAVTLKIERSSFPNQNGLEAKRIATLTGDDLKWENPARLAGGKTLLAWKRAQ